MLWQGWLSQIKWQLPAETRLARAPEDGVTFDLLPGLLNLFEIPSGRV